MSKQKKEKEPEPVTVGAFDRYMRELREKQPVQSFEPLHKRTFVSNELMMNGVAASHKPY